MSNTTPEKEREEEVDLIVFLNFIGNFFNRIVDFFKSILKGVLSILIFILKTIIDNFKVICIVMILATAVGFALQKVKKPTFTSSMFVKPYFDSKYQLVNNIDYFNALLSSDDFEGLANVFSISVEDAKTIDNFDISIGPESENEKVSQYDTYLKSLDSIRAQEISYDDFVENRNIYSSDFFEISVEAKKKDIFKKLEAGFNSSFENTYSAKKMKKRDSLIYIQKQAVLSSIRSVDSLQQVYIRVLQEDSKSTSSISLGEGFTVEPDASRTKEFELLNKELKLRDELRKLEERKIEEDVFFDTVSGFQEVGSVDSSIYNKYIIVFPILAFIILCFIFSVKKTISFVKNYEQ